MNGRLLVTSAVASGPIAATLLQPAFAAQPSQMQETRIGRVLADPQGLTRYTYDEDASGKSACEEPCAEEWPPFQASEGALSEGDYTVIERSDGSHQWAYKGKPLYTMSEDAQPGDTNGEGKDSQWHAARP